MKSLLAQVLFSSALAHYIPGVCPFIQRRKNIDSTVYDLVFDVESFHKLGEIPSEVHTDGMSGLLSKSVALVGSPFSSVLADAFRDFMSRMGSYLGDVYKQNYQDPAFKRLAALDSKGVVLDGAAFESGLFTDYDNWDTTIRVGSKYSVRELSMFVACVESINYLLSLDRVPELPVQHCHGFSGFEDAIGSIFRRSLLNSATLFSARGDRWFRLMFPLRLANMLSDYDVIECADGIERVLLDADRDCRMLKAERRFQDPILIDPGVEAGLEEIALAVIEPLFDILLDDGHNLNVDMLVSDNPFGEVLNAFKQLTNRDVQYDVSISTLRCYAGVLYTVAHEMVHMNAGKLQSERSHILKYGFTRLFDGLNCGLNSQYFPVSNLSGDVSMADIVRAKRISSVLSDGILLHDKMNAAITRTAKGVDVNMVDTTGRSAVDDLSLCFMLGLEPSVLVFFKELYVLAGRYKEEVKSGDLAVISLILGLLPY